MGTQLLVKLCSSDKLDNFELTIIYRSIYDFLSRSVEFVISFPQYGLYLGILLDLPLGILFDGSRG